MNPKGWKIAPKLIFFIFWPFFTDSLWFLDLLLASNSKTICVAKSTLTRGTFWKKIIKKYSFLTKWRQKCRNWPKWARRIVISYKMAKNDPMELKISQDVQFRYIFKCIFSEIILVTSSDVYGWKMTSKTVKLPF